MTKAQLIEAGWLLLGYSDGNRLALDPAGNKWVLRVRKGGRLEKVALVDPAGTNHVYLRRQA